MAHFSLLEAAADKNLKTVKSIVDQGADQDSLDQALSCAVAYSHIELAEYLLDKGAQIEWGNNDLLYWATHNGEIIGAKFCLANGVDINVQNGMPLCISAWSMPAEFVEWLIGQGADVNINQGKALINAIIYQRLDNVRILLNYGANPHLNKQQALREAQSRMARGNQITVDIYQLVSKAIKYYYTH